MNRCECPAVNFTERQRLMEAVSTACGVLGAWEHDQYDPAVRYPDMSDSLFNE